MSAQLKDNKKVTSAEVDIHLRLIYFKVYMSKVTYNNIKICSIS